MSWTCKRYEKHDLNFELMKKSYFRGIMQRNTLVYYRVQLVHVSKFQVCASTFRLGTISFLPADTSGRNLTAALFFEFSRDSTGVRGPGGYIKRASRLLNHAGNIWCDEKTRPAPS